MSFVACGGGSTEINKDNNNQDSSDVVTIDSSTIKTADTNALPENITGTYVLGDMDSPDGGGYLVVEEQANDSIKFELNMNIGAPNYNSGTATGLLKLEENTATFATSEYAEDEPCKIIFTFNNDKTILIDQKEGSPFSCGFGNRVFANGLYTKQKEEAIFQYEGGF